jgi:hypothetical protein
VVVQLLVIVGANVAAWEDLFEVLHEGGVDRHQVFKVAVDGAVLHHEDLAVALDDLSLDLSDLLVQQNLMRQLAVDNLLTDRWHALWAQRIGGAGPAEGRFLLLVALQKRLVAPARGEAVVGADLIEAAEYSPTCFSGIDQGFFKKLCGSCFRHGIFSPENADRRY